MNDSQEQSSQKDNAKLWGGRFSQQTNTSVEKFTESVSYDKRLAFYDIKGSIAHVTMLGDQGILTKSESQKIVDGLAQIEHEIDSGRFQWHESYEDVHMNIEARLTDLIGDVGKKLHTGRSRNDQVATDMRLYIRDCLDLLGNKLNTLSAELINLAEKHYDVIMPGFTHMQCAQPVTFGHHLLAWTEMLIRDKDRMEKSRERMNISPLGCAALAGTTFPIDRFATASAMEFSAPSENSLDTVSDRDFMIETNFNIALMMTHFSRMAEEMVLWSSPMFGFIDLGDSFCTGSSIMPQKKNPDVAELLRGKSARAIGNLQSLIVLMKSQPLAYNRDNQEDKEPVFDSIDTAIACLDIMIQMMPNVVIFPENMRKIAKEGYATATDLADYLVNKGIPFRDAHEIVGKSVNYAIQKKADLSELDLEELKQFSQEIDNDVFDVLTLEGSVNARNHIGGTAPEQVKAACQRARKRLNTR